LRDVLKTVNFNRKVGQRTMHDSMLVQFSQHFDEIQLGNDDFEFPDLLGTAYEGLIKFLPTAPARRAANSTRRRKWCA
jgi:type I restriction enzyme M protein